jgi:hypothetical protein
MANVGKPVLIDQPRFLPRRVERAHAPIVALPGAISGLEPVLFKTK